jgi:hypothetical protein
MRTRSGNLLVLSSVFCWSALAFGGVWLVSAEPSAPPPARLDNSELEDALEAKIFLHGLLEDQRLFLPGPIGPVGPTEVEQAFDYYRVMLTALEVQLALVALDSNAQVGHYAELHDLYDFSIPTYSQIMADEAEILLEWSGGQAHDYASLLAIYDEGTSWAALLASKLLAAAGAKEGGAAFVDLFTETFADGLRNVGRYFDNKQYKSAIKTVGSILSKTISREFGSKLAARVGTQLAGKILAKVGSKFVPIVGWAWFGGALVWAIVEQAF